MVLNQQNYAAYFKEDEPQQSYHLKAVLVGNILSFYKAMDKQTILQKLQSLNPQLQQEYGLSEPSLFGLYSRDEQTAESDIDVMVNFTAPIGIEYVDVVYQLQEAFKEIPFRWYLKGN